MNLRIIFAFNVDCFPLFFGRFLFPSILCRVFNKALWSIFIEARLFVLAHFLVYVGDFIWACLALLFGYYCLPVFVWFLMLYAFTSSCCSLGFMLLGFIFGPYVSIIFVKYNTVFFSFFW